MTSYSNIIQKITACIFTASMLSCSSTEVIDSPPAPVEKSRIISMNISNPAPNATRATSDHKLRYVAKLLDNSDNDNPKEISRQEVLVDNGADQTIIFSVEPGKYKVLLFADYLPSGAVKGDDGFYPDNYYNTTDNASDPKQPGKITVKKFEVNNDNLDCFYYASKEIIKDETKHEESITLERAVSKVRFVSKTPLEEGKNLSGISFTKLSRFDEMNIGFGKNPAAGPKDFSHSGTVQPQISSSDGENELFFFYTFASLDDKNMEWLGIINFTMNYSDGSTREISLPRQTVKVKRNSITTVKGSFLSAAPPVLGDIILNLTVPSDWGTGTDITIED